MKLMEVECAPKHNAYRNLVLQFAQSEMNFAEVILDEGVRVERAHNSIASFLSHHKDFGVKASRCRGKIYLRKEEWV